MSGHHRRTSSREVQPRLIHRRSSTFSGRSSAFHTSSSPPLSDALASEEPPWGTAQSDFLSSPSPTKRILPSRTVSIDDEAPAAFPPSDANDSAATGRARSGSLVFGRGMGPAQERPSMSSVGLRLAGLRTTGAVADIPSPPNTNSDAGSGPSSGSLGQRSGAAMVAKRNDGVLTPESSERAGSSNASTGRTAGTWARRPEARRSGSDVGTQRSGSVRRATLMVRSGTDGSLGSRSQSSSNSSSKLKTVSQRQASQPMRRSDTASSSSSRAFVTPASSLAQASPRIASPADASPTKTVVASKSPTLSSTASSRRSAGSRGQTDALRSSSVTVRPKRSASGSGQSSEGLGPVRVKAKDRSRHTSGDEQRPTISRSKQNDRILAAINATLTSPPTSPGKDRSAAVMTSPAVAVTPPSSFLEPPGSHASSAAEMPFAQGRSPAPRKVVDDTAHGLPWDGSVRRLGDQRGAEAFAAAEVGHPIRAGGSTRRIAPQEDTKDEAATSSADEAARKRVEDWSAATKAPSSSVAQRHRRQLSETLTSSSGTARDPHASEADDDEDEPDAETTPGKGKAAVRRLEPTSRSMSHGVDSADELGGLDGEEGRRTRNATENSSGSGTWSGRRARQRSHTSLSQYRSTVSNSRGDHLDRPVSRAATALGSVDSRGLATARRIQAEAAPRKARPGLPDDFLAASSSPKSGSPLLHDARAPDMRSSGSGSTGRRRPFPSTPGVNGADTESTGSGSYRRSTRLSDLVTNRNQGSSSAPRLSNGRDTPSRLRHQSLTDGISRSHSNLSDVVAGDRARVRARSSLSPSTLSFGQSIQGRASSRLGDSPVGGDRWWNDLQDLRSRIGQIDIGRTESEASGPSRGSSGRIPATPANQAPRERTLRGVQTAPGPSRNGHHPEGAEVFRHHRTAGSTSRFGLANESPRTPLQLQLGRMSSLGRARPDSASSTPFSPTPDVETHRLLRQAYEALERHFGTVEGDESTTLIDRVASAIRSTCRLNSELHALAASMQEAQVEMQLNDDGRASSSTATSSGMTVLAVLERTAGRALAMSETQVRDLTEALLAMPRADRERSSVLQDEGGFRPASRAGTATWSRAGSPSKSNSPVDRRFSSRAASRANARASDDSPTLTYGHRRGASAASALGGGHQRSVRRRAVDEDELDGEVGTVEEAPVRRSKGSGGSVVTSATMKGPPTQFPRSPSRPSPQVSGEHAEAGRSPTKRRDSAQFIGGGGGGGLGLVYSDARAGPSTAARWRRGKSEDDATVGTTPSPQSSPRRRSLAVRSRHSPQPSIDSSATAPGGPTHGRRTTIGNAAAALERIGSITSRTFGRSRRPDDGRRKGSAQEVDEEDEVERRNERQDRINDILRRSASRASALDE